MLVLTRKLGQELRIGDDITVVIHRISGNRVAIAIDAPEHVRISRGEIHAIRQQFETAGNDDQASVRANGQLELERDGVAVAVRAAG